MVDTDGNDIGKRRYNIKLWKTFTDCFNCLPIAAIIDEKIFTMHGGLSPDLQSMEQIRRVMRPTDVPDTGQLSLLHPCRLGLSLMQRYITILQVCCAICSGPTQTKTSPAGPRTIVVFRSLSAPTSSRAFYRSTIWTLSAVLIRSLKMGTSFLPRGSSLLCSPLREFGLLGGRVQCLVLI